MSNEELFKKIFEEKFNKEEIKKEIISKEFVKENNKKIKLIPILKLALAPICLTIIISSFMVFGGKKVSKPDIIFEENNSAQIYVNKIKENSLARLDCDIKTISKTEKLDDNNNNNTANSIQQFEVLKNLKVPEDFNKIEYNLIYVSNNENNKTDNVEDAREKKYDILNNYSYIYYNEKNERSINISFSNNNEPVRDYFFTEENSKISKINNIELKIYNYEKIYFTEFIYNDYYFDIETRNITQEELITLLASIIQ